MKRTHSSQMQIAQGIFSRIAIYWNLNKLKSIEIILRIFSDYNGMKLEIRQIKMEVSVGTTNSE